MPQLLKLPHGMLVFLPVKSHKNFPGKVLKVYGPFFLFRFDHETYNCTIVFNYYLIITYYRFSEIVHSVSMKLRLSKQIYT